MLTVSGCDGNLKMHRTSAARATQELCLGGSLRDKVLKQMTMWNKARLRTFAVLVSPSCYIACMAQPVLQPPTESEPSLQSTPAASAALQALYTYTEGLRWTIQITEGLAYLHGLNPTIIHRDLKLDNVLMSGEQQALKSPQSVPE